MGIEAAIKARVIGKRNPRADKIFKTQIRLNSKKRDRASRSLIVPPFPSSLLVIKSADDTIALCDRRKRRGSRKRQMRDKPGGRGERKAKESTKREKRKEGQGSGRNRRSMEALPDPAPASLFSTKRQRREGKAEKNKLRRGRRLR